MYPCTISSVNGSLVSFLQFLKKYFNLLALGRLVISARNKVATSRRMWLNFAGSRSSGILTNKVCGNIVTSSWQSCMLLELPSLFPLAVFWHFLEN